MINVKDLRIGNYVNYNGFTYVVHSIKQKESRDDNFKDKDFVLLALDGIIGVTVNNIEPIPLTEQILIDFGFRKKENYYHISDIDIDYCINYADFRNDYGFYIQYTDSPFIQDENKYYPVSFGIKYAHQLQNLYHSLTGEELTKK